MAIRQYLAMTAAEFHHGCLPAGPVGWLSCLFSPYGTGLSNLPKALPEGALLILSDLTPMRGHDGDRITLQLQETVNAFRCCGVLLDFQRPRQEALAALAQQLSRTLPCPVAVSEPYGDDLERAVFLPPIPPGTAPDRYLAPWQGREIWLELSREGEQIILTEDGANCSPLPPLPEDFPGFPEEKLHCHYRIETSESKAVFTLWRTKQDQEDLLNEAQALGVTTAVGLWQELRTHIGWG